MLHLMHERDVLFVRLALNGFARQYDIAEMAVDGARAGRKREHVGRFRDAAKTLVEQRDVSIGR